ncbi:SAM-dependent methyltransferase [Clostridium acetobutylicum]|nr:SAM-dependent methyltransferase [Clostridium acetobutylicum]
MQTIIRQPQLYRFLKYCNESSLDKTVLDCGAGGDFPPLSIFVENGYRTYGIEISNLQLKKAENFSRDNNLKLNISKGDIRKLPFKDESISFVYSYGTIFYMRKNDVKEAMDEVKRVLKPGGLACINFLTTKDGRYNKGEKIGDGEFLQLERGEKVIHSYVSLEEADKYFKDMKVLFKEDRVVERINDGLKIKQGYVDYIAEKLSKSIL